MLCDLRLRRKLSDRLDNDSHQPRSEGFGLLQRGQTGEGLEESFLGNFQGILEVSEKPICNGGGPGLVSGDQFVERRFLPRKGFCRQERRRWASVDAIGISETSVVIN